MSTEFKLPELGENVEKGDVVRVLVSPGDQVARDQPVLELETDKATIEVPSSVAGQVSDVRVKAGDQVKVGQVVLVVDGSGNGAAPERQADEGQADKAKADEGKADEGKAAKAQSEAGGRDASKADEPEPEPEADADADKATEAGTGRDAGAAPADARADAPEAGSRSAGRSENVVDISAARSPGARAEAPARDDAASASDRGPVPASPSVRRFAREVGVDIADVEGTGPGGRIGQEDVKQFVKARMKAGGTPAGVPAAPPLPDFSKWGSIDVQPMSNIRRKTAEHLSVAWQAPHVTQNDKADVTALEEFRASASRRVEKAGAKLTVTAIVIKLLGEAIDRFPHFASSVDMANDAVVVKHYRHIGVAVDTERGLLVPVIRDVTAKTVTEIALELGTVSQKARDRKLSLDDMSGGVMTVTNLGGIGGTSFSPVINHPEVAILGLSRTATEPVWRDGAFVPRQMLPLSLSYDHRVIDGADAARFLRFLVEAMEQPLSVYL